MTNSKKIISISFLRVIACIGVFNGHFLGMTLQSDLSTKFLSCLRNGWLSRTPLCLLFQGDTNVKLFFCISGFLLVFSMMSIDKKIYMRKCLERYISLVFPSIIVTLFCAFSFKIQEMLNVNGINFSIKELINDTILICVKGGIPYYSYQLWYVNVLIKCIFWGILFLGIVSIVTEKMSTFTKERMKIGLYVITLIILLFPYLSSSYFAFFSGMFVAEMLKMEKNNLLNEKSVRIWIIICVMCMILFPYLYNEDNLRRENEIALSISFSILVLGCVYLEKRYIFVVNNNFKKMYDFIDKNTYSFYLLHVFVLRTFSSNFFELLKKYTHSNEILLIVITWIATFMIVWYISSLYTENILNNLSKHIRRKNNENSTL